VQSAPGFTYTLDSYGNMRQASEERSVFSQLAFLSDEGFSRTIPDAGAYYFTRYQQQLSPEQGKYTTILDLVPTDPTLLDELYEYVPSMRRSAVVASGALCAGIRQ
jgi:hypothetical protein